MREHPYATCKQIAVGKVLQRFDFFSHKERTCLFARGRFYLSTRRLQAITRATLNDIA